MTDIDILIRSYVKKLDEGTLDDNSRFDLLIKIFDNLPLLIGMRFERRAVEKYLREWKLP